MRKIPNAQLAYTTSKDRQQQMSQTPNHDQISIGVAFFFGNGDDDAVTVFRS
jgi:hypothetical protein